jgi:hypothetical protein
VPVAHACNPSCSGSRDQEDLGWKPAWEDSSRYPVLKKPITKRAGGVGQGIGLQFKPQAAKKNKTEKVLSKITCGVSVASEAR